MTASDWTGIIVGAVLIVQGWQQNRIFERQNRIIAKDTGAPVPANASAIRLARYWPTLVNVVLAISIFAAVAYDHFAPARPIGATVVVVPWAFAAILAGAIVYMLSRSKTGTPNPAELFTPLQIEALAIAKDLRDFYAAYPFPDLPDVDFGMDQELQRRILDTRLEKQAKWRQKIAHAYANKDFGQRITSFLHRFGEHYDDAPIRDAAYAENLERLPTEKTIPKLAQEMEMLAIWINRKERSEVDLLHPKL